MGGIKSALAYLDWPFMRLMQFLVERFSPGTLGPLDAFRYGGRLDTWERNSAIRDALLRSIPEGNALILDVGGNANELARLLPDRFRIVVADLDRDTLRGRAVCADAARLPFVDGTFGAVVSADTLEHIPEEFREEAIADMLRVRKQGAPVIMHFPAHDGEEFRGEDYDRRFLQWHERLFGKVDRNTEEHLACGLPGIEWIKREFSDALVQGRQHGPTWLRCMILERLPFCRLVLVAWYAAKERHAPPYHACLVEIP